MLDGENRGVYHRPVDDVTAFVLAGGKSTRMGRDKAFLELDGKTLLERAVDSAREVTEQVWIVGDQKKFSRFGPVVGDVYRERGPLGGIHIALTSTVSEWNLILAVDLPFLTPEFLKWLVAEAQKQDAVVTVPRVGGRLQPLCAVYRKQFGEAARRELDAGRNKIANLFGVSHTRVIQEGEVAYHGFSAKMFQNVNTPEEWVAVTSTEYPVPSKKTRT